MASTEVRDESRHDGPTPPENGGEPEEDPIERVNRELIELLNEIRIALPGVQVLFAFLLTVPFTQRFGDLTDNEVRVYFAALLTSAASAVLLMAPATHHRLNFRKGTKNTLLVLANYLVVAGMVLLATAVALVLYLVAAVLYDDTAAALVAAAMAASTASLWFVVPLIIRMAEGRSARSTS